MKVSIIGSGKVGLSLGAMLASAGFELVMTDKDPEKKSAVRGEALPFYEPGLQDKLGQNQKHLEWTRYTEKIMASDFIFFCLSAPVMKSGELDLTEVLNWAQLIIDQTEKEKFLVIKSTFPVGTNEKIRNMALEKPAPLHVLSCPEFLRQGYALKDLQNPDRLVIGAVDLSMGKKLEKFYKKFCKPKEIIHTDPQTAELSKLACNSFLAIKISFSNELAGLCERLHGDPQKLQLILGSDPRIGKDFLNPGLGYGGCCMPKDVQLSVCEGKKAGHSMNLLKSAQKINESLPPDFVKKIISYYKNLKKVPLTFWGISFKKNTDDLKHSPALALLCHLLSAGAELSVYDPLFVKEKVFAFFDKKACHDSHIKFLRKKIFSGKVIFCKNILESLNGRQGLIIGSDWEEFQQTPLSEIKKRLNNLFLVDGRNLFSKEDLKNHGFSFYQRGCLFIRKNSSQGI